MADIAILKIVLSPYLSCESSKFYDSWYANANFDSRGNMTNINLQSIWKQQIYFLTTKFNSNVLEAIKLNLKNSKNQFSILAVGPILSSLQHTAIYYTTFETTSKTSCAVEYLTSLITSKARSH